MKQADEYFDRISKLPPEMLSHLMVGPYVARSKAIYLAAKAQWGGANDFFEKMLSEGVDPGFEISPGMEIGFREDYAWVLQRQGRIEEARFQQDRIQKLLDQVEERFGHANVQLSVMVPRKVQVGEEFEMRLDLVNVGRRAGVLVKIAGATPAEFKIVGLPVFCSLQNGSVVMKEKSVNLFQVETVKLEIEASKVGSLELKPEAFYVDDLGTTKSFSVNPITVTAQPVKPAYEALPGRITTGYAELDRLLLGGIPEKYAVALSAPSSDEREMLLNRFLTAGAEAGETTFYVTVEAGNAKALAEEHQSNFFLLVCNIQADAMIQNLPNIFKLKGIESLTEIDIALTKAIRTLKPSAAGPKRICIEIVSDVLLQHHAINTRRWLSALLPTLKSKGFTTLAVIDPQMHPQEEARAIVSLFDGEIEITQKETAQGSAKILKVRKLYNQRYLEDELVLTKEKLSL